MKFEVFFSFLKKYLTFFCNYLYLCKQNVPLIKYIYVNWIYLIFIIYFQMFRIQNWTKMEKYFFAIIYLLILTVLIDSSPVRIFSFATETESDFSSTQKFEKGWWIKHIFVERIFQVKFVMFFSRLGEGFFKIHGARLFC